MIEAGGPAPCARGPCFFGRDKKEPAASAGNRVGANSRIGGSATRERVRVRADWGCQWPHLLFLAGIFSCRDFSYYGTKMVLVECIHIRLDLYVFILYIRVRVNQNET